jgi:SNF2 family DNA or RNA helicase
VFKAEYTELILDSLKLEHFHDSTPDSKQKPKKKSKGAASQENPSPATQSSLTTANDSIASLDNLRTMLGPFVLRRLKRDVLHQLVAKKEQVIKIKMTDSQRQLYGDIIQSHLLRKNQNQKTTASAARGGREEVIDTGTSLPLSVSLSHTHTQIVC